jgi:CheY-like chemotaxis protein/anti-sigma regulatory factor (Ser/Thr protein kinase)
MFTILIVDDSAVERRLAGGLLQGSSDFTLQYADNGKEALEIVAGERPDVVVTDLVMPEMDGLGLLRALRKMSPPIPVILMTAYGNEEIAAEAMGAGAVSYVPKSLRAATLLPTVRQVLERVEGIRGQKRLDTCLDRIECSYVLDNDPALLKSLVDMVENTLAGVGLTDETQQVRVGIALEEALLNALYHGNLSIDEADYPQVRHGGQGDQLAAARREEDPYRDRRITFKMTIARDGAQFVIRHEGGGCPAVLLELTSNAQDVFEKGRNRGLALIRYLMDEVQYNEQGNEVKLSLRKREPDASLTRII